LAGERFDSFISYSRASSTSLATDLQSGIERLAKPWHKLRVVRVFRDDQSMAANSALWSTIEKGLHESAWFVLLATPQAAASEYVNNEIRWWLQHKGSDTLLLVHAGGRVGWDRAKGDFAADADAIPPALRGAYREEPRWVDLSWHGQEGALGAADPRFIERVADLSAAIRGIERDTLLGDNVRLHRQARRFARAAIAGLSVLLALALVAGGLAFVQRSEAVRQRDAATQQSLISRARQLAATAVNDSRTDLQSAMVLAATAHRTQPEFQTELALHEVITTTPQLVGFTDFGESVTQVEGTPDASVLVGGTETGKVYRVDRGAGERTQVMDLGNAIEFLAVSDDGKTISATSVNHEDGTIRGTGHSAVWRDGELADMPGIWLRAMSPTGNSYVQDSADALHDFSFEIVSGGKRAKVSMPDLFPTWVVMPDDRTVVAENEYGNFVRASADGATLDITRTPMGVWMFGGAFSHDGTKFTYTNGGTEIEVWDLTGPLQPSYDDGPLSGTTGQPSISGIALSPNGARMATAADGSIFVSDVHPTGQPRGFTELRGAGLGPHSLSFLTSDLLLSASGTSAALWDLRKVAPLTTSVPVELNADCSACGPPRVVPSPNLEKVLVINNVNDGAVQVDLSTGHVRQHEPEYKPAAELDQIWEALPAVAWLDDNRLFAYDTEHGKAWIINGDKMDQISGRMDLPAVGQLTKTAIAFGDRMVLLANRNIVTVDMDEGHASVASAVADVLTSNGAYAVAFDAPKNPTDGPTKVSIVDTDTGKTVQKVDVDGALMPFAAHTGDAIMLLREVHAGAGSQPTDTEVLSVGLHDGAVRRVAHLGAGIDAKSIVSNGDGIFVEQNGSVVRYSLHDGARLNLLPVQSAPREYNALGLTPDDTTLFVASAPSDMLSRVPITVDAWTEVACKQANRTLRSTDLESLASTAGLVGGCGESIPD
jgi:WD40 repeat protein